MTAEINAKAPPIGTKKYCWFNEGIKYPAKTIIPAAPERSEPIVLIQRTMDLSLKILLLNKFAEFFFK